MSGRKEIDLERVRADGWFDRVVSGVPALQRLCVALGEPLVALSLAAGVRILSAALDRTSGDVTELSWSRERADGGEVQGKGSPAELRAEVLAALLAEPDPVADPPQDDDPTALRKFLGPRYVLLCPLFGLTLRRLVFQDGIEVRIAVYHDNIEEVVTLKQLRRFLRGRVTDALQSGGRGVSIDLEQVQFVRTAFASGRFEEVVARLSGWVGPLMIYHRTAEGAALDPKVKGELGRGLAVLGEAYARLGRAEEGEEAMRLALQYAQEGDAAADTYQALARTLVAAGRFGEALGPLRRALALAPERTELLLELATSFVESGRAVAALGCLRRAKGLGASGPAVDAVTARIKTALGDAFARYEATGV